MVGEHFVPPKAMTMIDDNSDVMLGNKKWSRASFRVFSNRLNSTAIASELQMEPFESYDVGDLILPKKADGPRRKEAFWSLSSSMETSDSLESHIAELVSFIESNRAVIEQLRPHCVIDLFCSFSSDNGQGGITLKSDLLTRLAVLRIDLIIDLYPPERVNH